MIVKRILAVIFSMIFIIMAFPAGVNAEEALKAPTVQYKILNHDKVSLRWNKIDGAESYYIYKRNDETGKYIKKYEVTSNAVTLKKLSPDTEYSYAVVAVKDGVQSKSSNKVTFTTPSEWYYFYKTGYNEDHGYRQHYDGSGKEESDIAYNITYGVRIYHHGWIYYTDIANERDRLADDYTSSALYRVKNDGTEKTFLSFINDGQWVSEKIEINNGSVFILSQVYAPLELYFGDEYDVCIYPVDECELFRLDLDNSEAERKDLYSAHNVYDYGTIYISKYIADFIVTDDSIYYIEFTGAEVDSMYKSDTGEWDQCYKLYKMNIDGTAVKYIADIDNCSDLLAMYNNYIYYTTKNDEHSINRLSLNSGVSEQIFYCSDKKISDGGIEFINGYFYIKARNFNYDIRDYEYSYYRVKADGTGLTKSDKPFEWKY